MAELVLSETADSHTPDAAAVDALFVKPDVGDAAERLRVYAGAYPARIEEVLKEIFPTVAHVVGDSAFHGLVRRYVRTVPLHSYNLNDAGAELPQFLRSDRLCARLPFLADLGKLEWLVTRAFHAHEEPTLDPTPLSGWSADQWENAVLRFQPSVAVLPSEWPIREIWECRDTPIDDIDIDVRNRPDRVLVRRSGFAVICESLDGGEADALGALLAGQTLGDVSAALAARGSDPASASQWFSRWMAYGMIVSCSVSG